MDKYKKFITNRLSTSLIGALSIAAIGTVLGKLFRYLMNVVIATGFNAEVLGFFTFGLVLVRAGSVVASLGFRTSSQRFISVSNERNDPSSLVGSTIISISTPLVFGSLLAIGSYLVWPYLTATLNLGISEDVRIFFFAVPLYATMNVAATATRGFKQTKYYVYIREFGQSGSAILLITIASYWLVSVDAAIISYFLSLVIGCVLGIWYLYNLDALRRDIIPDFDIKDTFKISLPLLIVAASQYLISWTDVLMLGGLTSSADVGHYQAAFLYASMLHIVFQSINAIFPSMAAELYAGNKLKELRTTYSLVTKWGIYITAVATTLVTAYANVLLQLFGTGFTVAKTALVILAIGNTIALIPGPASFMLSMSEFEWLESINTVVFGIVNVVLNYLLIQPYGIVGAAIATSVSLVGMNFLRLGEVWWHFEFHPFHRGYIKGVIALIISTTTVLFLRSYTQYLSGAIIVGFLAFVVFGGSLLILGLDDQDQRLLDQA